MLEWRHSLSRRGTYTVTYIDAKLTLSVSTSNSRSVCTDDSTACPRDEPNNQWAAADAECYCHVTLTPCCYWTPPTAIGGCTEFYVRCTEATRPMYADKFYSRPNCSNSPHHHQPWTIQSYSPDMAARIGWLVGRLRGTVVERWSVVGELFLSCARPTADE